MFIIHNYNQHVSIIYICVYITFKNYNVISCITLYKYNLLTQDPAKRVDGAREILILIKWIEYRDRGWMEWEKCEY